MCDPILDDYSQPTAGECETIIKFREVFTQARKEKLSTDATLERLFREFYMKNRAVTRQIQHLQNIHRYDIFCREQEYNRYHIKNVSVEMLMAEVVGRTQKKEG